ncbi:hypothetical protein JTB14_010682 [Gonioctena quinquepunctata]|nr:hypothetical protein JTB14_010682 [Gonioctena quinquepunctata]
MGPTYIFVLVICVFGLTKAKDLPDYFPRCHRFDKNLNKCLLDATDKLRKTIGEGIPSLKMPRFEPFFLKELIVEQGTRAVNFKADMKDILIYNLTSYKFSRFDFNVSSLEIFGECSFKNLKLKGDYEIHGKFLVVPLEGAGNLTVSLDDCSATVHQKFKIQKRKGLEYLTPILTNGTLVVGTTTAQLDGLFGGNAELANFTNKFINENSAELVREMQPVLNKVLSDIVEDLVIKVISNQIPFGKLFPK